MTALPIHAVTVIASHTAGKAAGGGDSIGTGLVILSLIGLVIGVVVLLVVVSLFNRVLIPAREIGRYADDILEGGVGITRGVDGVDELARTRELASQIPGLADSYRERLGAGRGGGQQRQHQQREPEGAQQ